MREPYDTSPNEFNLNDGLSEFGELYDDEDYNDADGEFGFDEDGNDVIEDIDFSQFKGKDFKSSLNKANREVFRKTNQKKVRIKKPLNKIFEVKKSAKIFGNESRYGRKQISKVIVPSFQKVIVEGVDSFILGSDKDCNSVKNIGYYKCKKLKELVLTLNNNSEIDFNLELFNPSMPLDYLFSTSGNLNNKIQVAGGVVAYTDVLYNILGNPMHVVNCKFIVAGTNYLKQINEPLMFKNKSAIGEQKIDPLQLQLKVDNMQVAKDIVYFDLEGLERPFIPNGMDVIKYKVLAGNTVTFCFYYRQKDLRKLFYADARNNKKLI